MSQPTDRLKDMEPIGEIDEARGEFWIPNPWKMNRLNFNVSAYEPNQVFLNIGPRRFAEIGYLTDADSDGDGRGILAADVTGDLQPDLIVRQSGGGPVRVYENRFPPMSRLVVTLEGTDSNAQGIGATIVAEVGGRELTRQVFRNNTLATSTLPVARFGLGTADKVDRLLVRWPSGHRQELSDVAGCQHIRIKEGASGFEVVRMAPPGSCAPETASGGGPGSELGSTLD